MSRHLLRLLLFLIGLAAGIFYAWKIAPIRYTDVPLSALRADYRTDYVLAIAEAYQSEQDLNLAISRLKWLNPTSPLTPVQEALLYAQAHGFDEREIAFLQSLVQALSTIGAEGGGSP
ncbi:MAG: hypothetical protein WHS87_09130 [Anaerolineales bacterium]